MWHRKTTKYFTTWESARTHPHTVECVTMKIQLFELIRRNVVRNLEHAIFNFQLFTNRKLKLKRKFDYFTITEIISKLSSSVDQLRSRTLYKPNNSLTFSSFPVFQQITFKYINFRCSYDLYNSKALMKITIKDLFCVFSAEFLPMNFTK